MLLARKRPADALTAFETTLKKEPNRFLALAGASNAATQKGDLVASRTYAKQLLTVASRASAPERIQLVSARVTLNKGRARQ
jgi:hypothetical protein